MKLLFIIIALSCYHSISASESSEELDALLSNKAEAALVKEEIKFTYNHDKYAIINDIYNSLKNHLENVTLVGTQNIYNNDGSIAEIRTIELHINKKLPQSQSDFIEFSLNQDDEEDFNMSEIKPVFEIMSLLGFEMSALGEEYNKDGGIIEQAYMDKNLVYQYSDGVQLVNRTHHVDSYSEIEAKIDLLQKKYDLMVAVHEYDQDNQFSDASSIIVPELVAKINSEEGETNQTLFEDILKGLVTSLLETNSNHSMVPGELEKYLGVKYPEYNVYVFNNEPASWYFSSKDFFKVTAQYDLASFLNDGEDVIYTIYGAKK